MNQMWLVYFLLLQIIQKTVLGSGYFDIRLQTFYNTDDDLWDGSNCEGVFGGDCDNMFEICVKQYPPLPLGMGGCLYYKKASNQVEATSVNFQSANTGISRSIRINVNRYSGVGFFMRITDYDRSSSNDHVDDHAYGESLTPGANGNAVSYSRRIYGRRSSSKSTLSFTVSVSCDQYYYSSTCEKYCKPKNDNSGHYQCSNQGDHVCLNGWFVLPDCLVFCVPQNDNTNGHYTCDNSGKHVCRVNWFNGPKCNTYCKPEDDDTSGHYVCASDGSHICRSGWHGGPKCLTYCVPQDDNTNGHYTCANNGSRVCRSGWHGLPKCLTHCVPHDDDLNGHYTCSNDGSRICRQGWFAEPNCSRYCQPQDNVNGHYTCDKNGFHVCRKNWHGLPNCTTFCKPKVYSNVTCATNASDICGENLFNESSCDQFCQPQDNMYGHFGCIKNGSRECRPNWFNLPNCTTFCEPKNDASRHYGCNTNGSRICNENWHNLPNCTTFCKSQNDSTKGHYTCKEDGSRVCREDWFNLPNCTTFCKARNDTNGQYTCASNGSHVCNKNWYRAPNCTTFCEPQNDSKGHYSCSMNGSRICHENWFNFPNCTTFCQPKDDEHGHYSCDQYGQVACNNGWHSNGSKVCNEYCTPQRSSALGYYNCSNSGEKRCFDDWYGPNCKNHCIVSSQNKENYTCDSSGTLVCKQHQYGVNCTVFCIPRDGRSGHFSCDKVTGKRICSFGWTGLSCNKTDNVSQPLTSTIQAVRLSTSMVASLSVTKSYVLPASSNVQHHVSKDNSHSSTLASTLSSTYRTVPTQILNSHLFTERMMSSFHDVKTFLRSSSVATVNSLAKDMKTSFTRSPVVKSTPQASMRNCNTCTATVFLKSSTKPLQRASSLDLQPSRSTLLHSTRVIHSRAQNSAFGTMLPPNSLQRSSSTKSSVLVITVSNSTASTPSNATRTPPVTTTNDDSDTLDWLINTNEGKTILSGSAIALVLIILLIAAIISFLRPTKPQRSKIIPFSNLEKAGQKESRSSQRNFHSNQLYDLHLDKATMRGSNPWSFDNNGSDDEDILVPHGSITPNLNYDRLVAKTDLAMRKVTIIPVKNSLITAYENPARKLLFEESCI